MKYGFIGKLRVKVGANKYRFSSKFCVWVKSAQHSVPHDHRDNNAPDPRQRTPGPHLHPIFELLGNSWQIVRLVQCRCGGGTAVLGDGVHTPCGQSGFVACSWFRQNGVISSHPCCAIPRRKHAGHNASRWAPVLKSKLVLCYT